MDSEHVFEQLVAQSLESCCILLNVGLYGSLNTFCHETADFEIYKYIITQIVNAFQVYLFMYAHADTHTQKNKHTVFGFVPSANTGVLQTDGQTQAYANETKRVRRL